MYEEVDRLLIEVIIAESYSEWCVPVVIMRKLEGKYRLCLNFRKINAIPRKDAYHLHYMTDIRIKATEGRVIRIFRN